MLQALKLRFKEALESVAASPPQTALAPSTFLEALEDMAKPTPEARSTNQTPEIPQVGFKVFHS